MDDADYTEPAGGRADHEKRRRIQRGGSGDPGRHCDRSSMGPLQDNCRNTVFLYHAARLP